MKAFRESQSRNEILSIFGYYSLTLSMYRKNSIYVLNASELFGALRVIHRRVAGVYCVLEHHNGFFYLRTNAPAGEKKSSSVYYLAGCRVEDVESNVWQIVIPPSEDFSLKGMEMFDKHMVLSFMKNGSLTLCSIKMPVDLSSKKTIMNIDDLDPWYFPVPSGACTITQKDKHMKMFMSSVYHAVVSSPVMPKTSVTYYMSENRSSLDGQEDKVKNLSAKYFFERNEVASHDGVRIPLTILYSRKMHKKHRSPGILYGYGAYGRDCLGLYWNPSRDYLLDAGWVFAFADVRGGSGVDPSWHKNGSGLNKMNSIKDFVACGEYLINQGYVHEHRLSAMGGSAGGLLVGAAINLAPHLFRAAVLQIPALDVCNSLMDPTLSLTSSRRNEYGNPEMKLEFENLRNYSPYDNIRKGVCYPSMLVTASFHDARVGVWEGAKWVAKVRESRCADSSTVLLKTSMLRGHLRRCYLDFFRQKAFTYAFLIKVMGM